MKEQNPKLLLSREHHSKMKHPKKAQPREGHQGQSHVREEGLSNRISVCTRSEQKQKPAYLPGSLVSLIRDKAASCHAPENLYCSRANLTITTWPSGTTPSCQRPGHGLVSHCGHVYVVLYDGKTPAHCVPHYLWT